MKKITQFVTINFKKYLITEMKNEQLPFQALTKGYVLLPKNLLMYSLNQKENNLTYFDAFLMVLTKVNYKDNTAVIRGCTVECKRGESLLSCNSWAQLFNWTTGKTRRFFSKMAKENLISSSPVKYGMKRIKVVDYDLWTGKTSHNADLKSRCEEQFKVFWNEYHEITQLPKMNIGDARKEWKKLSQKERDLAIGKIYSYCESVGIRTYFKNAGNYLKGQCFYNE